MSRKHTHSTSRLGHKLRAISEVQRLVEWAESQGIVLQLRPSCDSEQCGRKIWLNTSKSPETRLFYLLHELGHFLHERFPNPHLPQNRGYPVIPGQLLMRPRRLSQINRTYVVLEEVQAWEKGLWLAKLLKIKFDTNKFDLARSKALQTYFRWATAKKKKKLVEVSGSSSSPHSNLTPPKQGESANVKPKSERRQS